MSNYQTDQEDAILESNFMSENQNNSELIPLSTTSLEHFKPDEQAEILKIAAQIDVLQIEKIMSYGQIPLMRSFEEAGKILKEEQGTTADQEVIKQVIELSKQANESYEEFNISIREPNLFEKALLKIFSNVKGKREQDAKYKAITCYRLLNQLSTSCDTWIKLLEDAYRKITVSAYDDRDNCYELERYIVAGYVAQERIENELHSAEQKWQESGLIEDKNAYEELREGFETFRVVLLNLEKSRAAYGISLGQLILQEKTNKNIQIAVRTQKVNSMALAAQQLRNAQLDAKNREALEGQKSIAKLNDELMKKVAESTVTTADESERILLNGVYTVESALVAAKTVMDGCALIEKAREDRFSNISQEMSKLKVLVDELAPYIDNMNGDKPSNSKTQISNNEGKRGLVF